MTARACPVAAALAMALAPVAGAAAGMSTSDLGVVEDKESCMARASGVMARYDAALGADEIVPGGWSVYGWGLKPGNQDVVVLCTASTTTGNDFRRAVLVVYGHAGDAALNATRDVIKGYWTNN